MLSPTIVRGPLNGTCKFAWPMPIGGWVTKRRHRRCGSNYRVGLRPARFTALILSFVSCVHTLQIWGRLTRRYLTLKRRSKSPVRRRQILICGCLNDIANTIWEKSTKPTPRGRNFHLDIIRPNPNGDVEYEARTVWHVNLPKWTHCGKHARSPLSQTSMRWHRRVLG